MDIETHLRKQILFNSLKNKDLIEFLVQHTRIMEYPDDSYIYRQGNKSVSIFILAKGKLQSVPADGEYVIDTIRNGSGFGEICALSHQRRYRNIRSVGHTLVLAISAESLFKAAEIYPEFDLNLSKTYSLISKQTHSDSIIDLETYHQNTIDLRNVNLLLIPGCFVQRCVGNVSRIGEVTIKAYKILSR